MESKSHNKRFRVAHIAGGLRNGGVEAVIYNYCSRLNPQDYKFVYISYDPPTEMMQKKFEGIGFAVYSVTKKKENFFKSWVEVWRILKKHRINIIHSHMTLMCFITSAMGLMQGVKVRIAHSHLALKTKGVKLMFDWICKMLTRIFSTKYIACGKDAAVFLFGSRNFRKGRVQILNNAIDPDRFSFDKKISIGKKRELGITQKYCLGHIGRFVDQKNHAFLLKVYGEFVKLGHDCVLLLVGEGPLYNDMTKEVDRLGITEKVLFSGARDDANEILMAMDVMIFPSHYEGLPVILIEAQMSGLPVIISDAVTDEMNLIGKLKYISLNESAEYWAKETEKILNSKNNRNIDDSFKNTGYDINYEAKKLDSVYSDVDKK